MIALNGTCSFEAPSSARRLFCAQTRRNRPKVCYLCGSPLEIPLLPASTPLRSRLPVRMTQHEI
jgi:hypothetical protein